MPRISKTQISMLMFLHAFALGAYSVPLPTVLLAHGLGDHMSAPYIFAACAAFISPLIFGSLADRRFSPERLLGVVTLGAAVLMTVVSLTLQRQMGVTAFFLAIGAYHLWAAPGWGLLTSIGLMNVSDPQREFAPMRVWATIGFMAGAAFVSFVLKADRSTVSSLLAAGVFLAESIFLFTVPPTRPPAEAAPKRWRDYFGWDALQLLRDPDHRMIFVTTALFSMPLAIFYLYASRQLDTLQVQNPAGILSIAQIVEVGGMFIFAAIMGKYRLKTLIIASMLIAMLRYSLFSLNNVPLMVMGIACHGLIFTLFTMTTQIYVEQRVPHALRNQAQALLLLMMSGFGNLFGFLLGDLWYARCHGDSGENWWRFWNGLTLSILVVTVIFVIGYKGTARRPKKSAEETANPV